MTQQQAERYLLRIGYDGPTAPTAETLKAIQERHIYSVPYENLDILAGIRLSYEEDALYEKVVERKRGGYCFELNALFGSLLEALGFGVTHYFGRFLLDEEGMPMRRHRILRVRTQDGSSWIGDVGVGVVSPLQSVQLIMGVEQSQPSGKYIFLKDPFLGWVLKAWHHAAWRSLYSFTEEPQIPVDFVAASFFCELAPESIFNKSAMVSLKNPAGRITLDGDTHKEFGPNGVTVRQLTTNADRRAALKKSFGIELSDDVFGRIYGKD